MRINKDASDKCRAGIPMPAAIHGPAHLPVRRHLSRLDQIFDCVDAEVYYITCCVYERKPVLAQPRVAAILTEAWKTAGTLYKWLIGRYMIMPDHVHFFASPLGEEAKSLSAFMGGWKRWTRREIRRTGSVGFAWQDEFFDHLLRSEESYAQKWEYVRQNPVRKGFIQRAEDWPFQGELADL